MCSIAFLPLLITNGKQCLVLQNFFSAVCKSRVEEEEEGSGQKNAGGQIGDVLLRGLPAAISHRSEVHGTGTGEGC